jgi:NAD(P)-dependent dehydrogenase (short-subunit alcohol dehydrogenase family)
VAEGWSVIGWDIHPIEVNDITRVEVDVTDWDHVHELASSCPPIAVAVNAAGIVVRKPAVEVNQSDWDRVIGVNLTGSFYVAHALFPALRAAGGVLINIASITAHAGFTLRVAYSATKSAILSLTRTLALEWASDGVRVLAISPTFADTPLIRRGVEEGRIDIDEIVRHTPQRRLVEPDEIAGAVLRLAGNEFRSVTGSDVLLDGGFVAQGGF